MTDGETSCVETAEEPAPARGGWSMHTLAAACGEVAGAEDRRLLFEQLMRSIDHCKAVGSPAWSVTQLHGGFRLNVGQIEALACTFACMDAETFGFQEGVWVLTLRLLISGPHAQNLLDTPSYAGNMSGTPYRSAAQPHWWYSWSMQLGFALDSRERQQAVAELAAVQPAHQHFVVAACYSSTGKLRRRSNFARFNCAALVALAMVETGRGRHDAPWWPDLHNHELTLQLIPFADEDWPSLSEFALSAVEPGPVFEGEAVPGSLTALQRELYRIQRCWRWNDGMWPPPMDEVKNPVQAMRDRVVAGDLR